MKAGKKKQFWFGFFHGYSSLVGFFVSTGKPELRTSGDDVQAMRTDWQNVGGYIYKSMENIKHTTER